MSKDIALIASTLLECSMLISAMRETDVIDYADKIFYKGKINNADCVICISGVGKVNAAQAMTILAERFKIASVLNIGVAGAYPECGLDLYDIVTADKEVYVDEGLQYLGTFADMSVIGLPLHNSYKGTFYNEFTVNSINSESTALRHGGFGTVSSCAGTYKIGLQRKTLFNIICENMEGAAIAHTCLIYNLPFYEIRSISNIVQDRTEAIDKTAIIKAAGVVQKYVLSDVKLFKMLTCP